MAPPVVTIRDIAAHENQEVELRGWLYNKRSSGKLHFLQVRDGTGVIQAVVFKNDVPPEQFTRADHLRPGDRAHRPGPGEEGRAEPHRLRALGEGPGGRLRGQGVPHHPQGARGRLPHGAPPPLAPLRAAERRSCGCAATVEKAIRDYFDGNGFTLVDAPIFTPAACEGTTTLFEVPYFDLGNAYLTQSGQLYMEAAAAALGKVYCFGPTFRAEKSKTRRHLTEFWMVEPEVAFMDLEDDMDLAEDLVSFIVETGAREARAGAGHRARARRRRSSRPCRRPSRASPTRRPSSGSQKAGHPAKFGDDFGGDEETVARAASSTGRSSSTATRWS